MSPCRSPRTGKYQSDPLVDRGKKQQRHCVPTSYELSGRLVRCHEGRWPSFRIAFDCELVNTFPTFDCAVQSLTISGCPAGRWRIGTPCRRCPSVISTFPMSQKWMRHTPPINWAESDLLSMPARPYSRFIAYIDLACGRLSFRVIVEVTSNVPNLIADSGITLMMLRPLPVPVSLLNLYREAKKTYAHLRIESACRLQPTTLSSHLQTSAMRHAKP
jgi:hypothetical protein